MGGAVERYDVIHGVSTNNLLIRGEHINYDFSKYRLLRVYIGYGQNAYGVHLMDLQYTQNDGYQGCFMTCSQSYSDTDKYWAICSVNSEKTKFNFENGGYDTFSARKVIGTSTDLYAYIYRIEGIY